MAAPQHFYGRTAEEWQELRQLVSQFVTEQARLGRTTSYSEVNDTIERRSGLRKFDFDLKSERAAMGRLLGEISQDSFAEHGVMLSAIVIYLNENDAGGGFYDLAVQLGLVGPNPADWLEFWLRQVEQVHAVYVPQRRGRR
jgi:hypothetical protein